MSIESVMPSNHLILCSPLLLSSIFPSIRSALDKNPMPGHLFEGNPVGEVTIRRGSPWGLTPGSSGPGSPSGPPPGPWRLHPQCCYWRTCKRRDVGGAAGGVRPGGVRVREPSREGLSLVSRGPSTQFLLPEADWQAAFVRDQGSSVLLDSLTGAGPTLQREAFVIFM